MVNTGYTKVESCNRLVDGNKFIFLNSQSSWGYTKSSVVLLVPDFSSINSFHKKRIPSSAGLKRAMFKMSSKAISKALK